MRVLWLLATLPVCGQSVLTLAEAEAIAVRNHPRLASWRLAAEAAKEAPKQTAAALKPQLVANFTGVVAENGSQVGAGNLTTSAIFSRTAGGFGVNQVVWDFGRVRALTASMEARASALGETATAVRGEVLLRVRETYFRMLSTQIQLRALRENLETRRLTLRQISALAKSNLRSTLDVSFAELNVAEAELLLNRAESDVRAAEVELSAALGYADTRQYTVQDPGEPAALTADADAMVREAMGGRAELAALRQQVRAAKQFAESEKRQALPTLSALGAAGVYGFKDRDLHRRYEALGLNLNIPILNGGQFKSRAAEAELRAEAVAQDLREMEVRVSRDVRAAWVEAENARQRLALTGSVLEQARRTLRLAQTRYELGLGTIVELSAAQLSRTSAEVGAGVARFDYLLRRSALDFQMGNLR
ncbi:MAG: TolC family protein [Acidobacteria bacterium]|nr:TolC family protein [Acidobacteriota bacterium]